MSIVLVTGCFDVIHRGHIDLLKFAACYGTVVVGLNSDKAVRSLKGKTRPVNCYQDRAAVIEAIRAVSCVFEIDDIRVADAISKIRPDVWVKGGDYSMETLDDTEKAACRNGTKIVLFPSTPGLSTTRTLKCLDQT